MLAGPGPAGRVGALAVGEQSLGEPRPALERPFEAIDLEQVDADCGPGRRALALRAHSTVTVLARFRG
jgi:hypothetical protein